MFFLNGPSGQGGLSAPSSPLSVAGRFDGRPPSLGSPSVIAAGSPSGMAVGGSPSYVVAGGPVVAGGSAGIAAGRAGQVVVQSPQRYNTRYGEQLIIAEDPMPHYKVVGVQQVAPQWRCSCIWLGPCLLLFLLTALVVWFCIPGETTTSTTTTTTPGTSAYVPIVPLPPTTTKEWYECDIHE